jgi:hypothetical protein
MYEDAALLAVRRARRGDEDALAYVFDHVFYDVYHDVFPATRDRRKAEQATRKAVDRLPAMLQARRYTTLEQIRDELVREARRSVRPSRGAGASSSGMVGLRAVIRHIVLISAASIAAAGALLLVI